MRSLSYEECKAEGEKEILRDADKDADDNNACIKRLLQARS
jgi:hypothetical protein